MILAAPGTFQKFRFLSSISFYLLNKESKNIPVLKLLNLAKNVYTSMYLFYDLLKNN